ncbi:MAG: folate family ECF transporter S component [Epulopiscium sp.]|nr:folate family ECF transporter S component [Candidatus Epulonipiscium sp.]
MFKKTKEMKEVQKIVQTGLLLSIALVVRTFSYMLYIGGAPAIRISFAGPFSRLPAILFGPLYGGITSGLLDILGFLLKPEGGYIPWFTLSAIAGGVIVALVWQGIQGIREQKLQKILLGVFIALGFAGLINHIIGGSTYGLLWISLIGLIFLATDFYFSKKLTDKQVHNYFLKLVMSLGIGGIAVTTVNTYFLKLFIPALSEKSFMVLWIPRLVEEIIITLIQAYIMTILLHIYQKIVK